MTSDKTMNTATPDEIEALIPWYVTGKLAPDERSRVEAYLDAHPQARLQLELVGEEIDATLVSGDAVNPPSARMLDRLMHDIDMLEGPASTQSGVLTRLIAALTGWLPAAAPMGLRVAGLAAALVICVQATTIAVMIVHQQAPGGGFETASRGEAPALSGPGALVAFQDNANVAAISALLAQVGAEIVKGPDSSGVFVIRFKQANMDKANAAAALKALQARTDIVKFAAETR